ncbi:MAG: hypothetical protein II781_04630 [Clostridia bacterium]|nr:hypothetical protein [Clostridia bacterium]
MTKPNKSRLTALVLALSLLLIAVLSGCSGTPAPSQTAAPEPTAPAETEPTPTEEPLPDDPASVSERAMTNFLDKIGKGDYTMTAPDFLNITVHSADQVIFDYADDETYHDFAVMSVNNEVFQGRFTQDGIDEAVFLTEGTAMDAAAKKLPGYWLSDEVSEGNIYNLFYNDPEDPLKFTAHEDTLKALVRSYVGLTEMAQRYMHDIELTFDAEDPATARIFCTVDDDEVARYYFDDVDITITFGGTESEARADGWMQAPVYPEARNGWEYGDIFVFNSVFLPGYGEQAVPFLPFASYALTVDQEAFMTVDEVRIRDSHATEANMKEYADLLTKDGFVPVNEDGKAWYRKLLREDTQCFSSICLEYDNGLNVVAKRYYEFPKYTGLPQINELIDTVGYPKLPETEDLTDFTATDRKYEQIESWLYFFDYKTVLYADARYSDQEKAKAYLDSYVDACLQAGFTKVAPEDDPDAEADYYASPDGSMNFRYHFNEDGETVTLLFKAESYLTEAQVKQVLKDSGFPELDLANYYFGRDHLKFEKAMYNKDFDASITVALRFDSTDKADAFLSKYVEALEELGFLRVPASDIGSNKQNGYTDTDKGLGVAFDFLPDEATGITEIYFEFKSGIDFSQKDDGNPSPLHGRKLTLPAKS